MVLEFEPTTFTRWVFSQFHSSRVPTQRSFLQFWRYKKIYGLNPTKDEELQFMKVERIIIREGLLTFPMIFTTEARSFVRSATLGKSKRKSRLRLKRRRRRRNCCLAEWKNRKGTRADASKSKSAPKCALQTKEDSFEKRVRVCCVRERVMVVESSR